MTPLDKYGWPVERIQGRPIINAIRLLLHTRAVVSDAEWRRREQARALAPTMPGVGCAIDTFYIPLKDDPTP